MDTVPKEASSSSRLNCAKADTDGLRMDLRYSYTRTTSNSQLIVETIYVRKPSRGPISVSAPRGLGLYFTECRLTDANENPQFNVENYFVKDTITVTAADRPLIHYL